MYFKRNFFFLLKIRHEIKISKIFKNLKFKNKIFFLKIFFSEIFKKILNKKYVL